MGKYVLKNDYKEIQYKAIAPRVLFVAVYHKEFGYWRCFVDGVEGKSHEDEWRNAKKYGGAVSKKIADIIFPEYSEITYKR